MSTFSQDCPSWGMCFMLMCFHCAASTMLCIHILPLISSSSPYGITSSHQLVLAPFQTIYPSLKSYLLTTGPKHFHLLSLSLLHPSILLSHRHQAAFLCTVQFQSHVLLLALYAVESPLPRKEKKC